MYGTSTMSSNISINVDLMDILCIKLLKSQWALITHPVHGPDSVLPVCFFVLWCGNDVANFIWPENTCETARGCHADGFNSSKLQLRRFSSPGLKSWPASRYSTSAWPSMYCYFLKYLECGPAVSLWLLISHCLVYLSK
jgi:hypothetical protein